MGKFIKFFRKSNKRQSFLYKIFQISGYLKIFYPSNLTTSWISVNYILCRNQVNNIKSAITIAAKASTIGTALGTTQGSCLPLPCTSIILPFLSMV